MKRAWRLIIFGLQLLFCGAMVGLFVDYVATSLAIWFFYYPENPNQEAMEHLALCIGSWAGLAAAVVTMIAAGRAQARGEALF